MPNVPHLTPTHFYNKKKNDGWERNTFRIFGPSSECGSLELPPCQSAEPLTVANTSSLKGHHWIWCSVCTAVNDQIVYHLVILGCWCVHGEACDETATISIALLYLIPVLILLLQQYIRICHPKLRMPFAESGVDLSVFNSAKKLTPYLTYVKWQLILSAKHLHDL